MKSTRKPIKNLEDLENELASLKLDAKAMEQLMEHQAEHFKGNFGRMTINSIFGRSVVPPVSLKAGMIGSFMQNEKLADAINRIINTVADKIGEGLNAALDQFEGWRQKRARKKQEKHETH